MAYSRGGGGAVSVNNKSLSESEDSGSHLWQIDKNIVNMISMSLWQKFPGKMYFDTQGITTVIFKGLFLVLYSF